MTCRRFTGKTDLAHRPCRQALTTRRFANNDALREMRRALKPGASLGAIWNIENCRPPPVVTPNSPTDPDRQQARLLERLHPLGARAQRPHLLPQARRKPPLPQRAVEVRLPRAARARRLRRGALRDAAPGKVLPLDSLGPRRDAAPADADAEPGRGAGGRGEGGV